MHVVDWSLLHVGLSHVRTNHKATRDMYTCNGTCVICEPQMYRPTADTVIHMHVSMWRELNIEEDSREFGVVA